MTLAEGRARGDWSKPLSSSQAAYAKSRLEAVGWESTPDGCWLWLGSLNEHGYGKIGIWGRTVLARRLVREVHGEPPLPSGVMLSATCSMDRCVNPEHLTLSERRRRTAGGWAEVVELTAEHKRLAEDRLTATGWSVSPNGCWEWKGSVAGRGYGVLVIFGKSRYAHRLSHEVWNGPLGQDQVVRHSCDNPICINPSHLTRGSVLDNVHDAIRRGRNSPPPTLRGNDHPRATLSNDDVQAIRLRLSLGDRQVDIARDFGVTQAQISRIKRGDSWSHLAPAAL